ncbi:MAG: group II intron reverse transcriptase/maturase [Planctomycetales bacterium]
MLTALEQGVRGGKWHTLIDKVYSEKNLFSASRKVVGNKGAPGVDHVTVEHFESHSREELARLQIQLRDDAYQPQAVRRKWIDKPGSQEQRPLGIPTVRDRVVQTALRSVIEPIFDQTFAEHSYGFRPKRGCHHALEHVERALNDGFVHVVDADLKSYFDTINHEKLLDRIREKISDRRILELIEMFLQQGIMDGLELWTPEEGSPQGAVISPLLANIFLNPLDHLLAESGFQMVRYADDFVILCRTRQDAERALEIVRQWVDTNDLTLHPTKTRIVDAQTESFDFLGYRFKGAVRLPRPKSEKKLKDTVRAETKRTSGNSLSFIIHKLNQSLRGWFVYFRHCNHGVFRDLDCWIRGRLRSILRKRSGRRGRGRGKDHQRWPNRFFADRGLYSLKAAHESYRQSCQR